MVRKSQLLNVLKGCPNFVIPYSKPRTVGKFKRYNPRALTVVEWLVTIIAKYATVTGGYTFLTLRYAILCIGSWFCVTNFFLASYFWPHWHRRDFEGLAGLSA